MKRKFKAFRLPFNIPISIQISIFLVIIAFVPIASVMALKTYEKQLLEQTEKSNVQQARLVSASLDGQELDYKNAKKLLLAMNGRFDARIRILDENLRLLADSAVLNADDSIESEMEPSSKKRDGTDELDSSITTASANDSFVYRMLSMPVRIYRKYFRPPVQGTKDYYANRSMFDGNELRSALAGKYGAATRISEGQASVTLYSAVPILNEGKVSGVVLVSRSTYRILQNLYELRLDLGKIFLWSLLAVFLIAVFLGFRISRPLKKLAEQSANCADRKGHVISTEFTGRARQDEIGELSRSLAFLVERLKNRIDFIESFASDVSHEFKNPLAAIRSCTEILSDPDLEKEERNNFIEAIDEEVNHLQNLLTGVRNITKIDGGGQVVLQKVNLHMLACNLIEQCRLAFRNVSFEFTGNCTEDYTGEFPESYMERMLDNLLSNAAGFGTVVRLNIDLKNNGIHISVEDNGSGVPESERIKIFNRFYSNRPETEKSSHTGLGLSTVKAIVDAMGGEISVGESKGLGGASFAVVLHADSEI
ncbi:ATP-binding protein [Treponema sp.]|uniref:ATP-binding protein n=1 Tax=Treponema sp. TaxID=166 RepID=UPI00298E3136|nr:ATP-binding protein [Treponema sp.]MCQ2241606.1 ATP-binding protein [Treponema sp.]